MDCCNPKPVPADPQTPLESFQDYSFIENVPYREAVGSLLYLVTISRPDIAYAVSQVAKFCEKPGKVHWNAVKRIFAYLAGTSTLALQYGGTVSPLVGYTDADYAGDTKTRRSTTGFVFLLNGGPVSWTSRQQTCVSLSTTESEYVAASETSKEAIWLLQLINELENHETGPVSLFCDNQSAIRLVRKPEFHNRTKHIDVRFHFVREQQADQKIKLSRFFEPL